MTSPSLLPPGDSHDGFFLWGAPKAGKSGFIGALYGLSRAEDGVRWTAHPKDCDDPHTQEMVLRAYEELRLRRNTKTGVRDTPYRPLRMTLRKKSGSRQVGELQVALVDPAGEYSVDPAHRLSLSGKVLYQQVATSHGLLWLFEATPDGQPSSLDRLLILEQLVALLEAGDRPQLDLPVALCVTKIDCLSEERRRAALENPTKAVLDHLGHTTLTWFEAVCPRLQCFVISSAGVVPDKVRPIGLNEVLDWFEAERARRVRGAKISALRGRVTGFVKGWSERAAKGAMLAVLVASVAWGGMKVRGSADRGSRVTDGSRVEGQGSPDPGSTVAGLGSPDSASRAGGGTRVTRVAEGRTARDSVVRFASAEAARDSMFAAFRTGVAKEREGEPSARFFRRAHALASALIERGPPGARALVPMHLVRARACVLGRLECEEREVTEDLTWVLVRGDGAERRLARRMLEGEGGREGGR